VTSQTPIDTRVIAIETGVMRRAKKVKQLPVVENQKAVGLMSYNDTGWDLMLKHGDGMKG
jgi:predicted transcriptional regulator